jgi:hypothetical protein
MRDFLAEPGQGVTMRLKPPPSKEISPSAGGGPKCPNLGEALEPCRPNRWRR